MPYRGSTPLSNWGLNWKCVCVCGGGGGGGVVMCVQISCTLQTSLATNQWVVQLIGLIGGQKLTSYRGY